MSSPDEDEGSVWRTGVDAEGGEQAGGLGHALGVPLSSQGESGFPDPEGFEEEQEVMEAGRGVLWGREGRPGSPADVDGDTLDYLGGEAAMAILQQLTDRDDLGVRRNPSPESCDSEVSTLWVDLQSGPSGRGAQAHDLVGSPLPSAPSLHLRGPEGGRAWGNPKRGAKNRSEVTVGRQRSSAEGLVGSPSDSESSDEFGEMQLMRVSICRKGRGQAKPKSPQGTPRHSITHVREKFLRVPGSFLHSAPRPLASVGERQAVGELDVSSKKPHSVVWGKAGSRSSYLPGAAAAAVSLPKVTLGRKVVEKKFLGGASKVALLSTFPSWGQSVSAAPLEPATFPPISGIPLLGRGKRYSLVPLGTKRSKHTGAGQKSVARRKRESLPVMVEDKEPKREPGPNVPPPTHSPGPSCRECNSGDGNNRAARMPGHSQPLALSQGEGLPRGPTPSSESGDQEPLGHPPTRERQQQPPGAEGCPQCPELQRQIYNLRLHL
ncbi:PREDICTED: uncharacterized protein CXorf49 homolog, partial [Miniopterus natalensis]|uniref:uncharacterized protein CXorf49 homolog n=1 Tax=Miniopterus natalensis TaxID=291302 RepID=UPI0007A704BF